MNSRHTLFSTLAYVFVGGLSIVLAIWFTSGLMQQGSTQEADASQDPALLPLGSEPDQAFSTDIQGFLEPFIYDPQGRRDPFRAYTEVQGTDNSGLSVGPLLPLQKFDLDQLKLIGIIWDVRDPKAMFQDPNAKIYTVGKDERVGRNNGYIATIREGEIVVIETLRGRDGETIYTPRILRIER